MAELRWILLALGLLLIGGIWWRGTRRTGQAQGNFDLRDLAPPQVAAYPPVASATPTAAAAERPGAAPTAAREWPVSPLDPLRIRTADFDKVPVLDTPMVIVPGPPNHVSEAFGISANFDDGQSGEARAASARAPAPPSSPPPSGPPPAAQRPSAAAQPPAPSTPSTARPTPRVEPRTDHSDRFAPLAQPNANASERQKIISLRICALATERWPGTKLLEALELQGLAYGRYQVFHRNHVDGRSMFCVASLVEPGSFDKERMANQDFHGITAFAVLPGPLDPVQTVEALIATARRLAESLTGMVQDAKGMPLSPQRAAALREEAARFQAELT